MAVASTHRGLSWRKPWRLALSCGVFIAMILMLFHIDDIPRTKLKSHLGLTEYLPWASRGGETLSQDRKDNAAVAPDAATLAAVPPHTPPNNLVEQPYIKHTSLNPPPEDYKAANYLPGAIDVTHDIPAPSRPRPPPKANVPRPPPGDKIIVVGKTKHENTDWISEDLPDWQSAIYSVDDPTFLLHTRINKGNEANPYLTYIIDHYDTLPSIIAFIHPHKDGYPQAWHNDAAGYSNVLTLRQLNLGWVRRNGYANLRCNHDPGCPGDIQPFREPESTLEDRQAEHEYAGFWRLFFNGTKVPEVVGTPCCAQFAVSRERIRERGRGEYIRMLEVLEESKLSDAVLGRVYEYMWHVVFGMDPVYCPSLEDCYANVYCRGRGVDCPDRH